MTRIAFLVSSAREIDLKDSPQHPTGYWAEEALIPYERFVEAGAEVVVMTPDGQPPVADPYGLEPQFHYPSEDRDYFASIYRTFHHDPDDIRVTLHHTTELELVAARRIVQRLVAAGTSPADAHATVSRAAKISWLQDRKLVDTVVGFEYDSCCWIGRVVLERLQSSVTTSNTRLLFQIEFVGFSRLSLGSSPLDTFKQNVPRYQNLREQVPPPSRFSNYD